MSIVTAERAFKNKIMTADVYIALSSDTVSQNVIAKDLDTAIKMLKVFEKNYTRFTADSELATLNKSAKMVVSDELLEIITLAKEYYSKTEGLFDPTILIALLKEGYDVSKNAGFYSAKPRTDKNTIQHTFDQVVIDRNSNSITKPASLLIDLGGIGKGYIIDKVAAFLKDSYSDFCVSLGGDMYLAGVDRQKSFPYWAIEIDNPTLTKSMETPTLLGKDVAIATSGVNKRTWNVANQSKNHIIDPRTGRSAQNSLASVTVIGHTTIYADIMAKILLILGIEKGLEYCQNTKVPAVFITKSSEIFFSDEVKNYVWKD